MNMKLNRFIAFALCVATLAGCNKIKDDILNGDPYDSFVKSNYFTSETNVSLFANYFYNEWSGYGNGGGYGVFYFPSLNDNQTPTGYSEWSYITIPATNGTWSSCYTEIRRANTLLEALPGIASMNDAAKAHWMGVARLYRAWQHYCLVRSFGDCYYVDKVLDSSDEDVLYGPRTDRDAVMDKVKDDLDYAVANMKESTSRTEFNKAVAQAIMAEICLYEGTFCKYRSAADGQKAPDTGRANTFLTAAKTACQAIMSNSNYEVSKDYKAIYNSFDLSAGAATKEMILYKKYVYGIFSHSTIDYTCGSTQQMGMTKDAFDAYLFRDGAPLASTTLDKSDHGKVTSVANGTYADSRDYILDISDVLRVRDPRLGMQIDSALLYPGIGYRRFCLGAESTASTGYGIQKFDNPAFTDATRRNSISGADTDAPIFWLSAILLNYAEACAELGSCSQTDLDNSINKLRDRVGMPRLTTSPAADPANNMGVSNLIWEIRRERRVELMFDNNDRYWSLIRWHQLDKLDQTKYPNQCRGAWAAGFEHDQVTLDADGYINTLNGKTGRIYEAKYYLNPIPSGQSTLNPQIGQNYGWN